METNLRLPAHLLDEHALLLRVLASPCPTQNEDEAVARCKQDLVAFVLGLALVQAIGGSRLGCSARGTQTCNGVLSQGNGFASDIYSLSPLPQTTIAYQCWSKSGQIGRLWASVKPGQNVADSGRTWSKSALTSVDIGEILADSRPTWPGWAEFAPRIWAPLARIRTCSAPGRPNSTRTRPTSCDVDRSWPEIGNIGLHSKNVHVVPKWELSNAE